MLDAQSRSAQVDYVVGVDTGGTFSDFTMIDVSTGTLHTAKVPSTPANPADAIASGLRSLLHHARIDNPAGIKLAVVVGTTVATNAIIERNGATVLYVTTEGFTDIPFIGRLDKESLYDLHWQKPQPLVRRKNCIGVKERIDHHGRVMLPLDLGGLREEVRHRLDAAEDDADVAVAVCTLFSYLNPEHETDIADLLRADVHDVSLSHEVSPLWREYERAATTIADAFVKPIVRRYVAGVKSVVNDLTGSTPLTLMASNGGQVTPDGAVNRPSQLVLSGLAGGIVGASVLAATAHCGDFFSLDMGGTSCDIGLVVGGEVDNATEFELGWGLPITIPCVAVRTIGAGGGSIAWVDKGGLLRVGPQSAGAVPGPACYGTGGTDPTVTDANVVLGRLPAHLLSGAMALDFNAAEHALRELGQLVGLDTEEAAMAVVRTADENMANAIRLIAVERGIDARDYGLVAFGGAGPVHAREVASRLGVHSVLIPPHPGVCAAFGALSAPPRIDRVRTYYARSTNMDLVAFEKVCSDLTENAAAELHSAGRPVDSVARYASMRYEGQNYELEIEMPDRALLPQQAWERLLYEFEDTHARKFGFALSGEPIEITAVRVTARSQGLQARVASATGYESEATFRGVWFAQDGPMKARVYDRASLAEGVSFRGPAVVEELDSTTVIFPGDVATVVEGGSLLIEVEAK